MNRIIQVAGSKDVTVREGGHGVAIAGTAAFLVLLVVIAVVLFLRRDGQPSGPPVAGTVAAQTPDCESGWVVPDRGDQPVRYRAGAVAPTAEAVLTSGGQIKVAVQGQRSTSVVLQSMQIRVFDRRPAMKGVYLPHQCQEGVTPRYYRIDLDRSAPRAVPDRGTIPFPYRVAADEPEQFVLKPHVTSGDADWDVVVHWTAGEARGALEIPGDGQRFRTTDATAAREFCFQPGTMTWRATC